MRSQQIVTIVLMIIACSILAEDLNAQRRRTTRRDRTEEKEESMQDWLGISLGTLGFFQGFSISGKFAYGYEYEKRISIGANAKFFFDNVNRFNAPDVNFFTYGAAAFTRLRVTQDIFLQGEYNYTVFNDESLIDQTRIYPSIGGGYKSGINDWSYGFHLMFPLDEQVRDRINLEYWIDFNYKF